MYFTNGYCLIHTPTSGRSLSPKFGQGEGKGGGATTAIAVVGIIMKNVDIINKK